jgi:mRNA guanylyltransferase
MKRTGEQYDDRVIEVHWDPQLGGWRYMRFRDDKPNANHKDVVENIIQSIIDGVEKPAVSILGICVSSCYSQTSYSYMI